MHIAFLTNEYIIPPDKLDGGLATYLQKVSYRLTEIGHKVSVFCLSNRNIYWIDKGVNIYEVDSNNKAPGSPLSKVTPFASEFEQIINISKLLEKKVGEIHNDSPIDVIQIPSYLATGITLCNNGKIPVVCRISSFTPLLRNIYGQPNTLNTALTDWCQIHAAEAADGVFAPSNLMASYYSKFSSSKPVVIKTPPGRVISEMDDSVYLESMKEKKYLLFFGTLNINKGLLLISAVITKVLVDYPDLYFVFIGRIDKTQTGVSLLDFLRENNNTVQSRIIHLPSLPKSQLFPIIKNALGVLMPSLVENYPNACLEAQAFGKIVIGSRESSLDEMIIDGEIGLLVDNNNSESLEVGIRRLLNMTTAQQLNMENNILELAQRRSEDDCVGNLVQFYESVIDNFHTSTVNLSTIKKIDWDEILLHKNRNRKILKIVLPDWLSKLYSFFHRKISHL